MLARSVGVDVAWPPSVDQFHRSSIGEKNENEIEMNMKWEE